MTEPPCLFSVKSSTIFVLRSCEYFAYHRNFCIFVIDCHSCYKCPVCNSGFWFCLLYFNCCFSTNKLVIAHGPIKRLVSGYQPAWPKSHHSCLKSNILLNLHTALHCTKCKGIWDFRPQLQVYHARFSCCVDSSFPMLTFCASWPLQAMLIELKRYISPLFPSAIAT